MNLYRSLSCLTIALILSFSIQAQNAKIKWGPEGKGDRNYGPIDVLGWNQGNFYTMHRKMSSMGKYRYYLERLDENLKLVYSTKLDNKNYAPSFAKIIDDHIYFFQMRNKGLSMKEVELYYNVYDLKGNLLREEVLTTIEGLHKWNQLVDPYIIDDSPDGSKIGFVLTNEHRKEGYVKIINGLIEVNDLSKVEIHSTQMQIPEKPSSTSLFDMLVSNNGGIVNYYGYKEEYEDPFTSSFLLLGADGKYKEAISLKSKEGIYLGNIIIEPIGDSDYMFSGVIISKDGKNSLASGFFLSKLDLEAGQITSMSSFPYTEEFFQSLGYKVKDDGRIKFEGRYDLQIVPNEESGGGYLIADHYVYANVDALTEEALIIPFDNEGELGETIVLAKSQRMGHSENFGLGYFAFVQSDILHMIYSDDIENLNITGLGNVETMKDLRKKSSVAVLTTIDETGKIKKEKLFSYKEQGGFLVPEKCDYSTDKILLSIIDKKKVKYGNLIIE